MLGGDELSMTHHGNNNAYSQDNETTWLDWTLDHQKAEFLAYVRHLISLRNAHPALRPLRYVESESPVPHEPGIVSWRDADDSELMPGSWSREGPRVLMLTIEPTLFLTPDKRENLLMIFNGSNDDTEFRVPKLSKRGKTQWKVVLDTVSSVGRSDAMLTGGKDVLVSQCSILVATA